MMMLGGSKVIFNSVPNCPRNACVIALFSVFSYLSNLGEGLGKSLLCIIAGPSSWGHRLSLNQWIPGLKTYSGMKLGKGLLLLIGVTIFSLLTAHLRCFVFFFFLCRQSSILVG